MAGTMPKMSGLSLLCDKDASDELWRECAAWLTRWGMLRADHKANLEEASISDLANILRDGVLICKLLNKIDPGCIDMKDVNLKPAMAQFLSLRNIELFLKTCSTCFGLKENELFEPLVLFELTNFHKVLCTLSKLSLSNKALQGRICGFNAHKVESKEEEDIYQSLKAVDLPNASRGMNDSIYDGPHEDIYQDLCVHRTPSELQPTFEKRDFVIKELLDTEKNYVEVLSKLKRNFMKPLCNHMNPSDHEKVFYKINDLHDIHCSFFAEIKKSSYPHLKLSSVFMKWRESFLVYGSYCANLTTATNLLQELCDSTDEFNQEVIKHEKEDNNGRFKLRDVLSVPMQRILKYHLLLEKLIENTDPNHEEYNELRRAREAMLDVAGYINEAARDSEHLGVIKNLQDNIIEWVHTTELNLSDYGKLIKDGELKIKAHDDQKTRNRYVFIFDKCILICKQLKSQQFAFREIINISEYHVDEIHNRATLNRDVRWNYQFHLVKNDNTKVYTIFVRSMEFKDQMVKAIKEAIDNVNPQVRTNHTYELKTFDRPTQCFHCSKYLRGLIYQGYRCSTCDTPVHKPCMAKLTRCPPQPPAPVNGEEASLRDKLWFVGEMDRSKAQSELERREDGTFLVRIRPQSEENHKYALTLKTNRSVKHMKICHSDIGGEKKYYLSTSKYFGNVEELVHNYQNNSLRENFERLDENTKLLWPYKQLQATVLRSFDPTDNYQLRLREGSIIVVIGRECFKEGWWKGRNELKEIGYFPSSLVRVDGEVRFDNFISTPSRSFAQ